MKTFFKKWLKRFTIGLVLLSAALAMFVAFTPQGKTAFHTALFVAQVLEFPVKPQSWFTVDPLREVVTYPRPNGEGVADVYRLPDGKPRATVLLFLGANAAGRDDEDVVTLGNALARAGVVTMFHWSPTMALQYNIDPNEIENLVWAFGYLQGQSFVDPDRVGVGGFCIGGSFALIAASDPRIREDVAFINAFGPYYDARDLLLQVATRSRYYQDNVEPWTPDRLTQKVFVNELVEAMEAPGDQAMLVRVFVDNVQASQQELDLLSVQGMAAYKLLSGVESMEEAERLYLMLPAEFRGMMSIVSPRSHVADLRGQVLILHDRNDDLVPSAESRRLSDQLKESGSNVRYTELLNFEHVRPTSGGGIKDFITEGYKLFRHMYSILRIAR